MVTPGPDKNIDTGTLLNEFTNESMNAAKIPEVIFGKSTVAKLSSSYNQASKRPLPSTHQLVPILEPTTRITYGILMRKCPISNPGRIGNLKLKTIILIEGIPTTIPGIIVGDKKKSFINFFPLKWSLDNTYAAGTPITNARSVATTPTSKLSCKLDMKAFEVSAIIYQSMVNPLIGKVIIASVPKGSNHDNHEW